MIDCKITENYLKEKKRMCRDRRCDDCILDGNCIASEIYDFQKNIDTVQKWSDTHPIKTYLSDFLEKYPKATMLEEGKRPDFICVKNLGYFTGDCKGDCKACWNTPIENTEEVPQ